MNTITDITGHKQAEDALRVSTARLNEAQRIERKGGCQRTVQRDAKQALAIVAATIVVMLLFPPIDIYSVANSPIAVFGGFEFILGRSPHAMVNTNILFLEVFVVLVNAGIGWLLLHTKEVAFKPRRTGLQNATLAVVGISLMMMILFPPFESVHALTKATIPTFKGLYFIFAHHPNHVIVTTILYLETFFILINGALFWLIFRETQPNELTPEEAYAEMMEMRNRCQLRRV
jgi:hypothetical protein